MKTKSYKTRQRGRKEMKYDETVLCKECLDKGIITILTPPVCICSHYLDALIEAFGVSPKLINRRGSREHG